MSAFIDILPGLRIPEGELSFNFVRSRGPGGQNVNKVSTRVELQFDVNGSAVLSEVQKSLLKAALGSRLDADGILRVESQESRSQWQNRIIVVQKFVAMLQKALRPRKKRVPTKASAGSRERRFRVKKRTSTVKRLRRRISPDD